MANDPKATISASAAAPKVVVAKAPLAMPVKPPAFSLQSIGEQNLQRTIKMLIYGQYGIGKTYLAGSANEVPEMRDILLLNIESGDMSISKQSDIDTVTAKDFKTAARVFDFAKAHCALRDADNEEGLLKLEADLRAQSLGKTVDVLLAEWKASGRKARRYRTMIVDSLTEMDGLSMNKILGIANMQALDIETDTAEWKHYRQNFETMSRLVRQFRDLPMNVIFICAEGYIQDEQKRMLYMPLLTGKLAGRVQGVVDVVGYMKKEPNADGKEVRRLYVQPGARFAAKCRFPDYKLPYFDEPSMAGITRAVGLFQPAK